MSIKKDLKEKNIQFQEITLLTRIWVFRLGQTDFKGVQRDGIPAGNRIFRMPYFDPEGRMTIMQWNTAKLGVDYRIGPRETKVEKFTFRLPFDAAPGEMKVRAVLNYQLLVKPVADLLKVPADESEINGGK